MPSAVMYRVAARQMPLASRLVTTRTATITRHQCMRYATSQDRAQPGRGGMGKFIAGMVLSFVAAGTAVTLYPILTAQPTPTKPAQATIDYEKVRPIPQTTEDNRDIISSQHTQVKKSWENPGVFAWGSNTGRVAAPESNESVVKTPRRIAYFDGQLLRDIKLDREFGAAITEKGDLVQWGTAFSKDDPKPVATVTGKNLVKLAISRDRILALGKNGTVYSIPVNKSDQVESSNSATALSSPSASSSWFGLWSGPASEAYRTLKAPTLGWGESVIDISSGLEHALLLTSRGRVFSAASSASDFPSKGQLGIPGLTWNTRPQGPYDQPHEIAGLKGFNVTQIATGDYHSLALDNYGNVFVFGDNSAGQLGFDAEPEFPYIPAPVPVPFDKVYRGSKLEPLVKSIAAGGANSFFTVDAVSATEEQGTELAPAGGHGRITADVWACGSGIFGTLGNGRWTHVSLGPTKVKPLSGLFEWDEKRQSVVPIRVSRISVGSTHAAAVMDNATSVAAGKSKSTAGTDTNWGADVLFWGGNEYYQLGTGKRSNLNIPSYIAPLEGGEGDVRKSPKSEENRFQITPRTTARLGRDQKGRQVSMEQKVECGRFVSAVYSST
ncbi:regulator of chromosome condensation 1/beta-lactamase-inhibitor protein II [Xylariales sp. PMI_506]|nr:regulator of chromosome condensation 1/beta-lactamase-inhibitor protein II [Xylariales sp. PMI_506]